MPAYTNPGVYVSESPLAANVRSANNAQSVAAFIGTAARGPVVPTLINSWSGFRAHFGDISPSHELGYSVYHYFANGGRDAYVVRAYSNTSVGASAVVPFYPTGTGNASGSLFSYSAASPGTWGNSLKVETVSGVITPTATQIPTFSLVVKIGTVEVERWNEVSTDPASSRYIDVVVNNYSRYITVVTNSAAKAATGTSWSFFGNEVTAAGGSDGAAVSNGDYTTAINKLDSIEGALVMNAPGVSGASNAVVNALVQKAVDRGNSFVVIDPTPTDTTPNAIGTVASSYPQSSYAAVYYPMLQMNDPTKSGPGAIRNTYPGGAVVGAFIRSEVASSVAKAPAGYNMDVRNAFALSTNFTSADTGVLYNTHNVNTFKSIPGGGIIINGTRTLDKTTPGKYIPIRRSLNYVKQALKDATAFAVFEPNTEYLWTTLSLRCSSILNEFWQAGGLKGSNPAQAFYIVCNSSNNTAETVAQGQVNIEVGVAVQYPAEFVVINISQWTGGSNAASSL